MENKNSGWYHEMTMTGFQCKFCNAEVMITFDMKRINEMYSKIDMRCPICHRPIGESFP